MNLKSLKSLFTKSVNTVQDGGPFHPVNTPLNIIGNNGYAFGYNREQAVLEGYGQNPYAFMVINRIAERSVNIPYVICDANQELIESIDPLFNEILSNPNKEGLDITLYRMFASLLSCELFIFEQKAIGFDKITGFIVPNPQDVLINTNGHGEVIGYNYSYLGKSFATASPDECLHIKRPDITSQLHNGRSNLIAGSKVYQSNNEVWESEAALHKNKGIAGVLYSDSQLPMEHKERERLQKEYDKEKEFGGVKVSKEKLGYIKMGMNQTDLNSIESRVDHLRAMCALYNVDPKLFGDSAASTYNNMPTAKLGLIVDAVLPLLSKTMEPLFAWLSNKTGNDYHYKADKEAIPEMEVIKNEKRQAAVKESKGILEIQKNIMLGGTSFESAKSILMITYGYSEEESTSILG